jgi:hypothetical protein
LAKLVDELLGRVELDPVDGKGDKGHLALSKIGFFGKLAA